MSKDPQPTKFVLEHTPWSVSKASAAKECPKKFWFSYILKRKAGRTNADAMVGKVVHKAVEYVLNGYPSAKAFDAVLVSNELTTKEISRVLAFQPAVQNFIEKFNRYSKRHNAQKPLIELRLAVDLEGKPVKFFDNKRGFLRGVLDLSCFFKGTPKGLILDHKTGKEHNLKYFQTQFDSYIWLLKASYPDLTGIQVGINFLKTDVVRFGRMYDVTSAGPVRDRMINYLNQATRDTADFERTHVSKLCNWCDHKGYCPAHTESGNGKKNNKTEKLLET
jgi:RecB family exonuclease